MPKLRLKKTSIQLNQQDSISIGKYIQNYDQQTADQDPLSIETDNKNNKDKSNKKQKQKKSKVKRQNKSQGKSSKKNTKKSNNKTQSKQQKQQINLTLQQEQEDSNIQIKISKEQLQDLQRDEQIDDSQQQRKIMTKQQPQINFIKRLNRRVKNDKGNEAMNIILSKYTQQQNSQPNAKQQNNKQKYQSDIQQFELLQKKKGKKTKAKPKQKQIKVKNKYFSDISFNNQEENKDQFKQQPPKNDYELILQKKQQKRKNNLDQIIFKKVQQIKDKRQFKNTQTQLKYKNQMKKKLQQLHDAEQVQIDIAVPNLFTKKSTSAALYMKNTLQKDEKKLKLSQNSTLIRTSSIQSINQNSQISQIKKTNVQQNQRNQQNVQQNVQQNQQNEQVKKKKGIRRQDFFNNLVKQIKTKKQTNINSQDMKECFKTSNLDQNDYDQTLQDDVRSNNSSHQTTREKNVSLLERRNSFNDRENSNISKRSNKSISNKSNSSNHSSNSRKSIKIDEITPSSLNNQYQNSRIILPQTIAQQKSQVSSSNNNDKTTSHFDNITGNFDNIKGNFQSHSRSQIQNKLKSSLKFNTKQILEDVMNSCTKGRKFIQDHQRQIKSNKKYSLQNLTQQQSIKIVKKLKHLAIDISFNTKQNKQQRENKKSRKTEKSQKSKNKQKRKSKKYKKIEDFTHYFEEQAEYDSDQSGHSDQQIQENDHDLIDLIDQTQYLHDGSSQALVRQRFLQDQRLHDDKILEKLMKGIYGRRKYEATSSQKKFQQRRRQAALRHKLEDKQDLNQPANNINCNIEIEKQEISSKTLQQAQKIKQQLKLKQLQAQFNISKRRQIQIDEPRVEKASHWTQLASILPSLPPTKVPRKSGIKRLATKQFPQRKSIYDRKSNQYQDQRLKKKSVDKKFVQCQGNRNKLQKTAHIQLGLGNTKDKDQIDI